MALLIWLQSLTRKSGAVDVALRLLILGGYTAAGIYVQAHLSAVPGAIHTAMLYARGYTLFGIVILAIAWVPTSLLIAAFSGQKGVRGARRSAGKLFGHSLLWLIRVALMGAANTLVLLIQLLYSALNWPANTGERVVDASTHYIERMGDLLFGTVYTRSK